MRITEIISKSGEPAIYERGTAFMWTDAHISEQLLRIHLDQETDLASRKQISIQKTVDWILNTRKDKGHLDILDLGCGPGLYTEMLSKPGHRVTGIDISKTSVNYAQLSADQQQLNIRYINGSYLDLDLGTEQYDLVLMIYTDLGVLLPDERNDVLAKVHKALRKGGVFIFDLFKDQQLESQVMPRNWEAVEGGFWKATPYLALSESFLYKEQKVVLYQHLVANEGNTIQTFRFWTHFFSLEDIRMMLKPYAFSHINFNDDILPEGDQWNGSNVVFTSATK